MSDWKFIYFLPYVLSGLLAFGIAIYAGIRHKVPGARPLAFLSGLEATATFLFLFEINAPSLNEKLFFDNLQWIGVFLIAMTTLWLALDITGKRFNRIWIGLLLIFPLIFCALVFSNHLHYWIYPPPVLTPAQPHGALDYEFTTIVWVTVFYVYALVGVAVWLIVRYALSQQNPHPVQFRWLALGIGLPVIINMILTTLEIPLFGHRDTTPLFYGISNVLIAYSIFRHRLLNILPTAHDLVIENMPDAVVILNNRQEIIGLNPAARDLIPPQTDYYDGVPFVQIFPQWAQSFAAVNFSESLEIESSTDHQPGSILDLRGTPVRIGDGSIVGYFIVARDVSEQRRMAQYQRQLEQAINQSSSSIVITNLDSTIEYVNEYFTRLTGYTTDDVLGKTPGILKSGKTPQKTYDELWQTLLAGQAWNGEFINRKKNGEYYHERATIAPVRDERGVIRHYVAVKDDITAEMQMQQNLRIAERRYRSLFEQSTDAVFIVDISSHFLDVNRRAAEMLGYTHEELLQLTIADIITPSEQESSQQVVTRLLAGEHLPIYERMMRRKDGSEFPAEISAELVRDPDGKTLHFQALIRDISERRQTEQELRLIKERLELALWGGEVGLWDVNMATGDYFYNEQWASMLGYTLEELKPINTAWVRLIHPDDIDHARREIRAHKPDSSPYFETIYRMRSKSGEWKYILERGKLLEMSEDGALIRAIGTHLDVTESERVKQQLEESEERYRSIITALHDGIMLHDKTGWILTCNAAAERILGLTVDQLNGMLPLDDLWQVIRENGTPFPMEERPVQVSLRTGQPVRDVILGVTKPDGSLTWVLVNAQPLVHPGASVPYATIATFKDVTEQRQAQEALRQSEARFSTAFHNSPVPMVISTPDFDEPVYVDANEAYLNMVGYTWEDLKGKNIVDMGIAIPNEHRDERREVMDEFRQYRMKEAQIRNRAGEIRDIMISAQRVVIDRKEFDIEILIDVTERKRAEAQALSLSLERERVRFITQFIRSASHEFRTPLSIISTSVYLLSRHSDRERSQPQVERVETQIKRIIRLLDMLLLTSQLDSGNPIKMEPVSLNALIDQSDTAISLQSTPKDLLITKSFPQERLYTRGDEDYLRQMLVALLENAVRYTPVKGTININLQQMDGSAQITITDTGTGIPEAIMPYIFEPFWREDQAHTESGFGLGLSIARRIVELHGGKIEITSSEGQGTTALVCLPLYDKDQE